MNYRILGKTGMKVSEIGFGAWGIGGGMWARQDDLESSRALRQAFDLGVNFYDTAWVYGDEKSRDGRSERLIGRLAREVGRENILIASKVPPKNFEWPARDGVSIEEVFPKDWIVDKVHDSLRRLSIEAIDLLQFHVWQDDFVEADEWKEVIQDLTHQGKVKHWGISANDYQPTNVLRTLGTGLIESVQFIFNIFHQEPEKELLPYCAKNKIGLIARVPLDEGGLSGKITPKTQFGDFRDDYFKGSRRQEVFDRVRIIKSIMGDEALDLPELALRWVLTHFEVSTVIPGMRTADHVEDNVQASTRGPLAEGLMAVLKDQAWERNFYNPD